MSDERSTKINLPLVQSSGSLNSSNATNGNGVNSQQTPQTPTASSGSGGGGTGSGTSSSGGSITIQTTLPGSSSFSVGTKANQSIITDAPVTDPGGNTTKQVIQKHYKIHIVTPITPCHTMSYPPHTYSFSLSLSSSPCFSYCFPLVFYLLLSLYYYLVHKYIYTKIHQSINQFSTVFRHC